MTNPWRLTASALPVLSGLVGPVAWLLQSSVEFHRQIAEDTLHRSRARLRLPSKVRRLRDHERRASDTNSLHGRDSTCHT